MRRTWAALAAVWWVLLLAVAPMGAARAAEGERIVEFAADYRVRADGSVRVTEHLTWQFEGSSSHGIKRNIITSQGYRPDGRDTGQYRVYPLREVTASSPTGAPADVALQELGANTVIRIGSPDRTVSGTQRYEVSYTLDHVVNAQDRWVELYWNVTGGQTSIPTDRVRVTVTGPDGVIASQCYVGVVESRRQCTTTPGPPPGASTSTATPPAGSTPAAATPTTATGTASSAPPLTVRAPQARFSADGLQPFEQLTAVAVFPKAAFTSTAPQLEQGQVDSYDRGDSAAGPVLDPQTRTLLVGLSTVCAIGPCPGKIYLRQG